MHLEKHYFPGMIIMCFMLAGRLHFQWYFPIVKIKKKKKPAAFFAIHNFVFLISITQVSLSRNKLHIHESWFAVIIISVALYLWRLQVLESLFSGNYIRLAWSWGSSETPLFPFSLWKALLFHLRSTFLAPKRGC